MKTLPKKLSDRVLLALKDFEACEASPNYTIYMGRWHRPIDDGCSVCFAGAVMAGTLDISAQLDASPSAFSYTLDSQLRELDDVRDGSADDVRGWFDGDERQELADMSDNNRKQWKLQMIGIVGRLQAEGL